MLRRAVLLLLVGACGGGSSESPPDGGPAPDAPGDTGGDDAGGDPAGTEHGLFISNADYAGPIEWIGVDDSGVHPRETLAPEIPAGTRHSTWGYTDDGAWLFYTVDGDPTESVWARHRGGPAQRLDDGSRPYWSGLTWTNDRVFFVGESEAAFTVTLGDDGAISSSVQISRADKQVFSVPIAPSGEHVAMHYYPVPVTHVIQDMNALGVDRNECCAFGYHWTLSPVWGNTADRHIMVAGPAYEDRHLYVIGPEDTTPTPVHVPADDGGRYAVTGTWSLDDELIAYQVKMTIENFSNHIWIADVRGTPQRLEVTSAHAGGVQWRPGANTRQFTYLEYPAYQSQQRLMLATVTLDPLAVSAVPLVEHAPSDIFAINYEWNATGTAILHHSGPDGDYTVTFVDPGGQVMHVPVGRSFREEDATVDWNIPIYYWSKNGRYFVVLSNTGFSVGSIDVATKTVGPITDLPSDVHHAFFDRRAVN